MSTNCSNLIKTPLLPVATMASSTHNNNNHTPQKQTPPQQHPITTTKMGSRRIFSAQFKLQVLDSYRMDSDCKGNQRATARKYGIHRRQIQKWLQNESNLRSSVNNNNELSNHNKPNAVQSMCNGGATISNSRTVNNNLSLSGVDNVIANKRLLHENVAAANKSINQSAMSGIQPTNYNFTKTLSQNATRQNHPQRHTACESNTLSLDITRHSVATNVRANHHEPTIELNFNAANEYKCVSNATPSTNTSFSVSVASSSSSSSSASASSLAPSSFVARPVPHSMSESSISYSTQRRPLRIVSPSYLMPPNASHAMNGVSLIPTHPNNHFASTYQPQPFELNPMLYEASPSMSIMGTIRHLSAPHEFSIAIPPFVSRAMPSAFHFPQQNGFFENPSTASYDLYRAPTYLPPIAIPTPLVSEHTHIEKDQIQSLREPQNTQTPIDLTLPVRQSPAVFKSNRTAKCRFSLPSPPVKMMFNAIEIAPNSDGNDDKRTNINKPWDLRCSRKRKLEDDIDEGISVNHERSNSTNSNAKSESSPTPAKVVKLFKPYLLSSDDENEQNEKKCLTSDQQQKDPIIWSSHPFHEHSKAAATLTPFQSPFSTSIEPQHNNSMVPSSTYWVNHGSPVSGYDSASSTFSDCNCNDSSCQTKVAASPAPTVASFSDEFASSPSCGPSTENHSETNSQSTKYMIPRRHILEKWSHEDDELSHQFNRTQDEFITVR